MTDVTNTALFRGAIGAAVWVVLLLVLKATGRRRDPERLRLAEVVLGAGAVTSVAAVPAIMFLGSQRETGPVGRDWILALSACLAAAALLVLMRAAAPPSRRDDTSPVNAALSMGALLVAVVTTFLVAGLRGGA